jgi:hypothetical protein
MNASLAIRLQAMLAAALVSFAPAAHADLAKGLAAYDGGDYTSALRELTLHCARGRDRDACRHEGGDQERPVTAPRNLQE